MRFSEYMRLDGWVAIAAGAALCASGVAQGDQAAGDAVMGGVIMLLGTGMFMALWHHVPFRRPGGWFTAKPLARADIGGVACSRRSLLLRLLANTLAFAGLAIGLSFLTGFWLTYTDIGVWSVAIGAIKVGPATTAIVHREARSGATYRVASRPLRGLVQVTRD